MKMTKKQVTTLLPYLLLVVVALVLPAFVNSGYWIGIFIMVLYKVIAAVSLRTISLSGNLIFAHGSFIALGAYCAGILAKNFGLPPMLTILLGGLFAALVSVITGLPFVRLKGLYYSMASMFMGVTFIYIIKALKITGGYRGLTGIPSLFKSWQGSYYFFVAFTVLCLAILYRFEFSRIGTTLRALAQSADAASSVGINATFYRLLAVGVGCFFAGMMGACQALHMTTLSYYSYSMSTTLWIIMYMMIGGTGNIVGPMLGAIVITLVQNLSNLLTAVSGNAASESFVAFSRWVGTNSAYTPFVTSAVLLVVAYLLPGGLYGIPAAIRRARAKRVEKKEIAEMLKGGEKE